jgi:phage shock protein PspC (stress-responsive transcriptional regulator)
MKKTIIINLNGIIFNIDEDAYEKLRSYLETLKLYFGAAPETSEIIEDIEGRIAELFQPRVSEAKQSINITDVDEIIVILGDPEDIADANEENYQPTNEKQEKAFRKDSRRLYRDIDNSMLGGVCSGLAAYFGTDPVLFRLLFVVFLFAAGSSSAIYLILWIAVPAARTAAQKLEMRGEHVNVSNIERTFREEYQQVKKNVKRLQPDSLGAKIHDFVHEVLMLLERALFAIWSVLKVIFGISLILVSLGIALSMIGFIYFNNFNGESFIPENIGSFKEYLGYFINPASTDTLLLMFVIIVGILLVGLIYAGLKLIIRFKAQDRLVLITLSVVWILAVITLAIMVSEEASHFKIERTTKETVNTTKLTGKVLYIDASSTLITDRDKVRKLRYQQFDVNKIGGHTELYGLTRIDIERTSASLPEVEIERIARGRTRDDAFKSIQQIKVDVKQNDTILNIDPVFRLNYDQPWRFEEARIIVRLPVNMKIHLNENTSYLISNARNCNDYWNEDMAGKTWKMTEDGLAKVEK